MVTNGGPYNCKFAGGGGVFAVEHGGQNWVKMDKYHPRSFLYTVILDCDAKFKQKWQKMDIKGLGPPMKSTRIYKKVQCVVRKK